MMHTLIALIQLLSVILIGVHGVPPRSMTKTNVHLNLPPRVMMVKVKKPLGQYLMKSVKCFKTAGVASAKSVTDAMLVSHVGVKKVSLAAPTVKNHEYASNCIERTVIDDSDISCSSGDYICDSIDGPSAGLKPVLISCSSSGDFNARVTGSSGNSPSTNTVITPPFDGDSDIVRCLNIVYWENMLPLVASPAETGWLLDGLRSGVRIGRPPAVGITVSPNWPSASDLASQVSQVIETDLAHGRLYGPFNEPPFVDYIVSPLGAFLKRDSDKARVIHDLSFPAKGSVNAEIDPAEFSLQYSSIDDAVALCSVINPDSVVLAKLDLKDAFKHIPIHPGDWHMMGFSWPNAAGVNMYYFSKVLSFGLRSAPALFDRYARCLPLFWKLEGGKSGLVRYVDDFLIVASDLQVCNNDLDVLVATCKKSGFTIQPSKVTPPAKVIQFLGIEINTLNSSLRISDERMLEVRALLDTWVGRITCSKRQLLKLIGKLAFVARVVRKGRAFLGRLIALSKKLRYLHFRTRLNSEARKDISWWIESLNSNNGVCLYARDWSGVSVHHVYTDASDYGYGATWANEWFSISYVAGSSGLASMSINWRELHAAVKALATWGSSWAGGAVLFHVDNQATVGVLSKLYTPCVDLMELVRSWALLLEKYNIDVRVEYISTTENVLADHLSRGAINDFLNAHPSASSSTWPSDVGYYNSVV